MSAWVDGVLLSAADSLLLTDSLIANSLLGHELVCKEFTKFCGVFMRRNESPSEVFLFTITFSLTISFNTSTIETLSMTFHPRQVTIDGVNIRGSFFSFILSMPHNLFRLNEEDVLVFSSIFSKSLVIVNYIYTNITFQKFSLKGLKRKQNTLNF